jgi:capsid assembly protease
MKNYPHIAARVFNKPLLLEASYAHTFVAALSEKLEVSTVEYLGSTQTASAISLDRTAMAKFYDVQNGVAVIPVNGTLMHKSGYIGSQSGATGYDGIAALLDEANSNPSVRAIMLDIDSGGGEVSGVEALANKINASPKPVYAHANEMAASAAYWIASSASKVYLSNTASVGSIGVITVHADYSKQLNNEGVKVTIIQSGKHKAEGNPYEPLPADVREKVQAEIDSLRSIFAGTVAKNRKMTLQAVLDTEAAMYSGQAAVTAGLADAVLSFDDALKKVQASVSLNTQTTRPQGQTRPQGYTSPQGQKGNAMEDNSNHAQATGQGEQVDMTAVLSKARAEATTAERTRIAGILAQNDSATAKHLAFNTDMTPDAAAAILATVPMGKVASFDKAAALADMQNTAEVVSVQASQGAVKVSAMDSKMATAIQNLKGKK